MGKAKHCQLGILKNYTTLIHSTKHLSQSSAEDICNHFQQLPLTEYSDYVDDIQAIRDGQHCRLTTEPVRLLEPTGGTGGGSKLVPYNSVLQNEYQKAVDPWIADMFRHYPGLLFGSHYWSISPNTSFDDDGKSTVPIGFEDDVEYLSHIQQRISKCLMAVPSGIAKVKDMDTFEYLTLLFLIRDRDLCFISVWHPSFLTILLGKLPSHWPDLICDIKNGQLKMDLELDEQQRAYFQSYMTADNKRFNELQDIDLNQNDFPSRIWTQMCLISCWTGGLTGSWVAKLRTLFPGTSIQGKGIVATEGIVSIPFGREQQHVLAINSHFFEFVDSETGETKFAWEVDKGKTYSIVITTGSGLLRYKLHDLVEVTGFCRQTPEIRFLGRESLVSDIAGEKLHHHHVEHVILAIQKENSLEFDVAFMTPVLQHENGHAVGAYMLCVYSSKPINNDWKKMASDADEKLCRNYHYRHARSLGQLEELTIKLLKHNPETVLRDYFVNKGKRLGDIKLASLIPDVDVCKLFKEGTDY